MTHRQDYCVGGSKLGLLTGGQSGDAKQKRQKHAGEKSKKAGKSSTQYLDLETEAAKWNSAIIHFYYIYLYFLFPTVTYQNVVNEKGLEMSWQGPERKGQIYILESYLGDWKQVRRRGSQVMTGWWETRGTAAGQERNSRLVTSRLITAKILRAGCSRDSGTSD